MRGPASSADGQGGAEGGTDGGAATTKDAKATMTATTAAAEEGEEEEEEEEEELVVGEQGKAPGDSFWKGRQDGGGEEATKKSLSPRGGEQDKRGFEEGLRMRRREYDMPGAMPGMIPN